MTMMYYIIFSRAFHLVVRLMLVAGSVVFLRRGCASAAVSTLLGASIMVLMDVLNLLMLIGRLAFR